MSKRVDLIVTNDLVTDNRVHKVAQTLLELGYRPRLTGRLRRASLPLSPRAYATRRIRLFFDKGPMFYLEFNLRIFFRLLFSRTEMIVANDLDTLAACYAVSTLRRKKLVYDSHELFTEVPELVDRPFKRKLWLKLESRVLPKIKYACTVSQSIADYYRERYGTPFRVVRNLPMRRRHPETPAETDILPHDEKIVLYQGALNLGRGLEAAIQAMRFVPSAQLWLAGSGDLDQHLQLLTRQLGLGYRVKFLGRIPLDELPALTAQADLGLSIEEDLGLSYHFALPNKLFDYIQYGVPVLVSPLPEMKRVVDTFGVGEVMVSREPENLAKQITDMLENTNSRGEWAQNLLFASEKLCWEAEIPVLSEIYGVTK